MRQSRWYKLMGLALGASVMMGVYAQSGSSQVISAQPNRLANAASAVKSVSADGAYILFISSATNLVSGDTNGYPDLFLYRVRDGHIARLSVNGATGAEANGPVLDARMDAVAQRIVMETGATNLVAGVSDTNSRPDILMLDLGGTSLSWQYLSVDGAGTPVGGRQPAMSTDGAYICWRGIGATANTIFVYDTRSGQRIELALTEPLYALHGIVRFEDAEAGERVQVVYQTGRLGREPFTVVVATFQNGVWDRQVIASGSATAYTVRLSLSGNTLAYQGDSLSVVVYNVSRAEEVFVTEPAHSGAFDVSDVQLVYARYSEASSARLRLRDLATQEEHIVSVDEEGNERGAWFGGQSVYLAENGAVVFSAPDTAGAPWVSGDTNGISDIILRVPDERKTIGVTAGRGELASGNASGSLSLDFSAQRMVFASGASNLVPNDTNGKQDIFIRYPDGTLDRIVGPGGVEPDGDSYDPRISADGRYVVFRTYATNLGGDVVPGKSNIYWYEIATRQLRLLTAGANEDSFGARISGDGRYIVFVSGASNLVAGDTNGKADLFVYDTQTHQLTRVLPSSGAEPNGDVDEVDISPDGRYIVFSSGATNWVGDDTNGTEDIFVYDRIEGTIMRLTQRGIQLNGGSSHPSVSEGGRFVAFVSEATNIVPEDSDLLPDIYVWERASGAMELVSVNSFGIKGNLASRSPSLSADGRRIAFESDATNFMPMDEVPDTDVFVFDRTTRWLYAVVANDCLPGDAPSFAPVLSGDGSWVGLQTNASNLGIVPMGNDAYAMVHRVGCVPPGDVNRDGTVGDTDLLEVLFRYGEEGSCADVNMDGIAGDTDLLIVLFNYGVSCPQFVYGGDGGASRPPLGKLYPELFEGGSLVEVEQEGDTITYRGSLMRIADYKSLARQAKELDMAHRGLWPYPVAGRGSEPWVRAYGDPLAMDEAQLYELLERFHHPANGDFSPAQSTYTYNQSKSVQLGGSDVNISASGSLYLYATCVSGGQLRAEARGDARIKFFSLNYTVAEAYGLAEARNTQASVNAYFKLAGSTVWSYRNSWGLSYTYASQCYYGGSGSNIGPWTRQWSFSQTWWLGPVPVRVTAGINLQAGACYKFRGQLAPVEAEARFRPWVRSSAFAQGGVAWSIGCSASAGVSISLTLLNDDVEPWVTLRLGTQNNRCCVFINVGIYNSITALQGRFGLYAEACCWGLSGPGCGWWRKRQRWDWTLFSWSGYSASGHLWGPWSYTYCF